MKSRRCFEPFPEKWTAKSSQKRNESHPVLHPTEGGATGKAKELGGQCNRFSGEGKGISQLDILIAELLHLFIEKILVGERGEKWSRTAAQEIHIYYRNIGLLGDLTAQPSDNSETQQPQEVA